jgi:hypothetical protein
MTKFRAYDLYNLSQWPETRIHLLNGPSSLTQKRILENSNDIAG